MGKRERDADRRKQVSGTEGVNTGQKYQGDCV